MNKVVKLNVFLDKLEKTLPELCCSQDLIKLGIIRTRNTLSRYRASDGAPLSFRLSSGHHVYPRDEVLLWLKKRAYAGNTQIEGEEPS